jgi:hypothetical protein
MQGVRRKKTPPSKFLLVAKNLEKQKKEKAFFFIQSQGEKV